MDLDTQGHLLVYEKTKTDKNTSIIGKDNEHYQRLVIYKGGIGKADRDIYVLSVVEWTRLPRPIEPKEVGSRVMFTNLFLLQHSSEVPELYLNSEEEFRMFYELKRRTAATVLNSDDNVEGIAVGDYVIVFDQGDILLTANGKIKEKCAVIEFAKRPNLVFRSLLDKISILSEGQSEDRI